MKDMRGHLYSIFEARVRRAPEQILRYSCDSGAKPLLLGPLAPLSTGDGDDVAVAADERGSSEAQCVPACERCGAPRRFEFQVMPQLLYFLAQDDVRIANSFDFGTIIGNKTRFF